MSRKQNIMRIQHELARKGYDPSGIDGIWGSRTASALRAFQADNGLVADGIMGPKTSVALFGDPLDTNAFNDPAIPWFQEARHLLGVKEVVGPGNNPTILDWASDAGIPYKSDDIAWCGLFVAHCISSTMMDEPLPANPLGARQWLKFGAPCGIAPGAILVFWRVSPSSWKGHVGFYAGEDDTAYHVLGGNQGNAVSIARIAKDRLLEARWPSMAPLSSAGPQNIDTGDTMFSTDEA